MSIFTGSGVALVTPFTDNYEVDYKTLEKLILWHIKMHTDALIICGTTGESATITTEEHKEVIKFSVEVAKKRIPIIAGTGSNSTAEAIELSQYAEQVGSDALLLVTPYYNKPTQRGLYAHYDAIAASVSIPIILYNVPGRTAVNLEVETVLELAKIPNIVAIKEASGNMVQIASLLKQVPDGFDVYSGNDDQTEEIVKLGGKGIISVSGNIIPSIMHEIGLGRISNDEYQKFHASMFVESNPIPVKYAMNYLGINVGGYRLPLVSPSKENALKIEQVMNEYKLTETVYESYR